MILLHFGIITMKGNIMKEEFDIDLAFPQAMGF